MTTEEKDILVLAGNLLDNHYQQLEDKCREFKWICNKHLPQSGEGYVNNKNVFEIQDKTIKDLKEKKKKVEN